MGMNKDPERVQVNIEKSSRDPAQNKAHNQ
jgi:hypothetical protein